MKFKRVMFLFGAIFIILLFSNYKVIYSAETVPTYTPFSTYTPLPTYTPYPTTNMTNDSFSEVQDIGKIEYEPNSESTGTISHLKYLTAAPLIQLDFAEVQENLPDNFSSSSLYLMDNGFYQSQLFYGPQATPIGEIIFWAYSTRHADGYMPGGMEGFDPIHFLPDLPIIVDSPIVGDYAVMFFINDGGIGYRFQKNNIFGEIHMENQGMSTREHIVNIAQIIVDNIKDPEIIPMPISPDPIEQQYLNCFPAQGDLGFEHPFHQYFWYSQMTMKGFVYKTRYTNFASYTEKSGVSFAIDVNMVVNKAPITGQDIFFTTYTGTEDIFHFDLSSTIPMIGDQVYAGRDMPTDRPPSYGTYLLFVQGPVLVKLYTIDPVYDESTLDKLIPIAQKMSECLAQTSGLPENISPASSVAKDLINSSFLDVVEIMNLSNRMEAITMEIPAVEIDYNGSVLGLILKIKKQLPEPLTIAVYVPKYGYYVNRKQEKVIPPIGPYLTSMSQIDIRYNYLVEPVGEHEIHIWVGDQLVAIYPFYAGNWE